MTSAGTAGQTARPGAGSGAGAASGSGRGPRPGGPARLDARVVENRAAGAYRLLTIAAAGIAQGARPGQFAALTAGDPGSGRLLRRAFSLYRVRGGDDPTRHTAEIVVADAGPGTQWLTARRPGDPVDIVSPLGRPFPLPTDPVPCVLVGGGYGSAPLFWLSEVLRERGCHVDIVLGAADRSRLFGTDVAELVADSAVVTTDDGSTGVRGWVSDVLPEVIAGSQAAVVYACGPMPMLQATSEIALAAGAVPQVAVEEAMACGVGVCMTCVMPVRDRTGTTSMVRACVEGPTFRGDRIRWDAFDDGWCRVPDDCVGAPTPQEGGA